MSCIKEMKNKLKSLVSDWSDGAHDGHVCMQVVSTGGDGLLILAQREYKVLTYRSLQPHNDFTDRGVSQLPKYFYREHSLMLWEAIHGYIKHIMHSWLDTTAGSGLFWKKKKEKKTHQMDLRGFNSEERASLSLAPWFS